jgi:hypothetical protein
MEWEAQMAARARDHVEPDEHANHHTHLDGCAVVCSCGAVLGGATVVLPRPDFDYSTLRCWVCGAPGVAGPTVPP